MKTRLEAFVLAAVLAATAVTGGIALAGLGHGTKAATGPVAVQVVPAAAATPYESEGGDS